MNLFYKITRLFGLLIILTGLILFVYNLYTGYYGRDISGFLYSIGDLMIFALIGFGIYRLNKWLIFALAILGIILFIKPIIQLVLFGDITSDFIGRIILGVLSIYFIRNRNYLNNKVAIQTYLKSKRFFQI
ncbi:MAG: hypothetical protein NTX00_01855 [Candidatus Parcubacteria bacterium]|nr:hypothetical protein [Candidatus Parcubacteria bacterium]